MSCSSCSSSDLKLVSREQLDSAAFGRRGIAAGVASLTRTLGKSGESDRPSCSAEQHSFDAIAEMS